MSDIETAVLTTITELEKTIEEIWAAIDKEITVHGIDVMMLFAFKTDAALDALKDLRDWADWKYDN